MKSVGSDFDWQPIATATVGDVCHLRFRDRIGFYEMALDCFLHDDGNWYRVDPPLQMSGNPTHWRHAQRRQK